MIARTDQLLALTPTADHSVLEGYAVKNSSGSAALITSATATAPIGVITDGQSTSGKDSIALVGFKGTVKVKLGSSPGTVNPFTVLQLNSDATFNADAGSGSRILAAVALEAGSANELIEARLIRPVVITAATQDDLTDNSGGSASTTLASISDTATKNAVASLAAQLAKVKTDIAAVQAAARSQ